MTQCAIECVTLKEIEKCIDKLNQAKIETLELKEYVENISGIERILYKNKYISLSDDIINFLNTNFDMVNLKKQAILLNQETDNEIKQIEEN